MDTILAIAIPAVYVTYAVKFSWERYKFVCHVVRHEPDPKVRMSYICELFTLQKSPIIAAVKYFKTSK